MSKINFNRINKDCAAKGYERAKPLPDKKEVPHSIYQNGDRGGGRHSELRKGGNRADSVLKKFD